MNMKRLLLAIVAGLVMVFATDFLIHELWLSAGLRSDQTALAPGIRHDHATSAGCSSRNF